MDSNMSYIGRKACGCVVCAVVDNPARSKDVGNYLAKWVKSGLTIEHVSHDYVRENFASNCTHDVKKPSAQLTLFD